MPVRIKEPVKRAFFEWVTQFPESSHQLDMKRFYRFVKTKTVYRSKKWDNLDFFKSQILKYKPHMTEDEIIKFFELLISFKNYHKTAPYPNYELDDSDKFYMEFEINGEFRKIEVTKEEYMANKMTKAEARKRLNKN